MLAEAPGETVPIVPLARLNQAVFASLNPKLIQSYPEYFFAYIDTVHVPCEWYEDGKPKLYSVEHGPNHTYQCDYDAIKVVEDRIANGFRLFGKYYQALWD